MKRYLKPPRQHALSETNIKVTSNKCDTWDRSSDDRDDTCTTMVETLCVSTNDVHREKTTHAHKDKPSKSLEQTHKHDIEINMPKGDGWSIKKKKGVKTWQELMEWALVFATIKGKNQGRLQNLDAGQNLEHVAATTTLGNTLVEYQLPYFDSFSAQVLGLSRSIDSLCKLLWLPHLPHG